MGTHQLCKLRGTFILRRKVCTPFSKEEIASLPEKHAARRNPELVIERMKTVRYTNLPKFSTITNRVDFLFLGAEPETGSKDVEAGA
jgi:hypothetical protein